MKKCEHQKDMYEFRKKIMKKEKATKHLEKER
jgi:hypothetical protein